jgi:hypothetical protein
MSHCPACGVVLEDEKKPAPKTDRSTPQHRRFFAIIKAAYLHWPDHATGDFHPRSEDHLRYWLEMRADHYTVTTTARIRTADPEKVYQLVRAFMKHSEDERLFLDLDGNLLVSKRTKSICYDELDSREFSRLKDAVCDIIKEETGMDAEKLLRETERAA